MKHYQSIAEWVIINGVIQMILIVGALKLYYKNVLGWGEHNTGPAIVAFSGAALAYWVGFLFIIIFRRNSPTLGDIIFIRWAYLFLAMVFLGILKIH